jgi:hypothetical protein
MSTAPSQLTSLSYLDRTSPRSRGLARGLIDDAHDDDVESWNSGSNLSDGEDEMASLAANFGGIFAEMQEQAQENKKVQRNEMVQHWQLQMAVW